MQAKTTGHFRHGFGHAPYVSEHLTVIGCSSLLDVVDGTADQLWARFRRLGIYTREDVQRAAKTQWGTARALHVAHTEIFRTPVPLGRLRAFATRNGQTLGLRSPERISAGLFADIVRKGRS